MIKMFTWTKAVMIDGEIYLKRDLGFWFCVSLIFLSGLYFGYVIGYFGVVKVIMGILVVALAMVLVAVAIYLVKLIMEDTLWD